MPRPTVDDQSIIVRCHVPRHALYYDYEYEWCRSISDHGYPARVSIPGYTLPNGIHSIHRAPSIKDRTSRSSSTSSLNSSAPDNLHSIYSAIEAQHGPGCVTWLSSFDSEWSTYPVNHVVAGWGDHNPTPGKLTNWRSISSAFGNTAIRFGSYRRPFCGVTG